MIGRIGLFLCSLSALYGATQWVSTQPGEIITAPRQTTATTGLVFPFVTSQNGFETAITISNTSQDTLGSSPASGTCTVNFYNGTGSVPPQTTPTVSAGKQISFNLSTGGSGVAALPNFQGYAIANCNFPLARGYANVFGGILALGQDAQVVTLPRSTAKPQTLLFQFATNQGLFDTGIIIANTSQDPFGTVPNAGSCTLTFNDGTGTHPSLNTGTIPAGTVYVNLVSTLAPGFQGYVIASCNFTGAAGLSFVSDLGARNLAGDVNPELLTAPRDSTVRPLLFSSIQNTSGQDTRITIANTSTDPLGTAPAAGSCTINFYGPSAPAAFSTGNIASGTVWTGLASVIAPGFQGYAIATCTFPFARGWAFLATTGFRNDGDSVTAEVITQPRSTAPVSLLFSAASNWNTQDTAFFITNTSLDPFGTTGSAGTCTVSYFGGATFGNNPVSQTSTSIPPGGQLTFSLSAGNPAQGIAARPVFTAT